MFKFNNSFIKVVSECTQNEFQNFHSSLIDQYGIVLLPYLPVLLSSGEWYSQTIWKKKPN